MLVRHQGLRRAELNLLSVSYVSMASFSTSRGGYRHLSSGLYQGKAACLRMGRTDRCTCRFVLLRLETAVAPEHHSLDLIAQPRLAAILDRDVHSKR